MWFELTTFGLADQRFNRFGHSNRFLVFYWNYEAKIGYFQEVNITYAPNKQTTNYNYWPQPWKSRDCQYNQAPTSMTLLQWHLHQELTSLIWTLSHSSLTASKTNKQQTNYHYLKPQSNQTPTSMTLFQWRLHHWVAAALAAAEWMQTEWAFILNICHSE